MKTVNFDYFRGGARRALKPLALRPNSLSYTVGPRPIPRYFGANTKPPTVPPDLGWGGDAYH